MHRYQMTPNNSVLNPDPVSFGDVSELLMRGDADLRHGYSCELAMTVYVPFVWWMIEYSHPHN